MNKALLSTAIAASFTLVACGSAEEVPENGLETAGNAFANEADAAAAGSPAFPADSRIVEEDGVTYRVDADGRRVALGPDDSRIVVEDGVRYRVDPGGTRVRIGPDGAVIDVDVPDVDVDLPDVDAGINEKGNPDIDIRDDPDVNAGR